MQFYIKKEYIVKKEVTYDGEGLFTENSNSNLSVYLGNFLFSIDFNLDDKRAYDFGGILPKIIKKKRIDDFIYVEDASLYFESKENFYSGCNKRIKFDNHIYLDEKNDTLIIGKYDYNKIAYRIFDNLFIQLEDNNLIAVIIKKLRVA